MKWFDASGKLGHLCEFSCLLDRRTGLDTAKRWKLHTRVWSLIVGVSKIVDHDIIDSGL